MRAGRGNHVAINRSSAMLPPRHSISTTACTNTPPLPQIPHAHVHAHTRTQITATSCHLHYFSSRPGLWPIVVGVLKGLGSQYLGYELGVELVEGRHTGGGADHEVCVWFHCCVFSWPAAACSGCYVACRGAGDDTWGVGWTTRCAGVVLRLLVLAAHRLLSVPRCGMACSSMQ